MTQLRVAPPSSRNAHLLTHLLEMLGRGVRSGRALQEALGVDAAAVRTSLRVGAWLGLVDDELSEPLLTADGLAFVYAGGGRRDAWATALKDHPFVGPLIESCRGRVPALDQLRDAVAAAEPGLAGDVIHARAATLQGLLAGIGDERPVRDRQLALPLSQAPRAEPEPPVTEVGGRAFSPDVYRWLLSVLLDHGELTLGQVRGLLDRAGAANVPIGGYVDLALTRGDAVQRDERLVVTVEAVARREVAETTAALILSDGGWRAQLDEALATLARGTGRLTVTGRYRPWTRRLLGRELDPATLEADLARVLRDRSLSSWPRAVGPGTPPVAVEASFLDVWEREGLLITLPPSLVQLWEGLEGMNRRLRDARLGTDLVASPTLAYRPVVAHGGPLRPGEALPAAVPDERTLRQRVVANAPYVALLVALLHAHRVEHPALEIRHDENGWQVLRQRKPVGPLLEVLDGFARTRRWVPCRRVHGGLAAGVLVSLLERLGLAVTVGRRLVLDDAFFRQLRSGDEAALLARRLGALSDAVAAWVEGLGEGDRR